MAVKTKQKTFLSSYQNRIWLIAGITIIIVLAFLLIYSPTREALFGKAATLFSFQPTDLQATEPTATLPELETTDTPPILLSSCQTSDWQSGNTYQLTKDLVVEPDTICFFIQGETLFDDTPLKNRIGYAPAKNIVLDCNYHKITLNPNVALSDSNDIGIKIPSDDSNIVIKNCNIFGFDAGIFDEGVFTRIQNTVLKYNNVGYYSLSSIVPENNKYIQQSNFFDNQKYDLACSSKHLIPVFKDQLTFINNPLCDKLIFGTETDFGTCNDGFDNDANDLVDCADPNCDGYYDGTYYCEAGIELTCNDGFDNNRDGKTDCADPNCKQETYCIEGYPGGSDSSCIDGLDNDQDGLIDCADESCKIKTICIEGPGNPGSCKDKINNNREGGIDCLDPKCDYQDCSVDGEVGSAICINKICQEVACNDNLANDPTRLTDCHNPHCDGLFAGPNDQICEYETELTCNDEFDNDRDWTTDCDDSDCAEDPFCMEEEPIDACGGCLPCEICTSSKQIGNPPSCKPKTCPKIELTCTNTGTIATCTPVCKNDVCGDCTPVCPEAEICNDEIDNDHNGKTDCADPDCQGSLNTLGSVGPNGFNCCANNNNCPETQSCDVNLNECKLKEICYDNSDNDKNGFTDCADPDCDNQIGDMENDYVCEFDFEFSCRDTFDNDANDLVDCADPNCDGYYDGNYYCEAGIELTCKDGYDNDGDGLVDCDDNDCTAICQTTVLGDKDGSGCLKSTEYNDFKYEYKNGIIPGVTNTQYNNLKYEYKNNLNNIAC